MPVSPWASPETIWPTVQYGKAQHNNNNYGDIFSTSKPTEAFHFKCCACRLYETHWKVKRHTCIYTDSSIPKTKPSLCRHSILYSSTYSFFQTHKHCESKVKSYKITNFNWLCSWKRSSLCSILCCSHIAQIQHHQRIVFCCKNPYLTVAEAMMPYNYKFPTSLRLFEGGVGSVVPIPTRFHVKIFKNKTREVENQRNPIGLFQSVK